jgi:hypothetical protein
LHTTLHPPFAKDAQAQRIKRKTTLLPSYVIPIPRVQRVRLQQRHQRRPSIVCVVIVRPASIKTMVRILDRLVIFVLKALRLLKNQQVVLPVLGQPTKRKMVLLR